MAINPLQPPINYAGMIPQINIGQQFAELGQVLAERQKLTQAEEVKKAYATDLQAVLDNPSMRAFNDFSLKYPQQREAVKDVASRFTQEQQDAEFNVGRDIAVSLENRNPDAALNIVNQTIAARKNSNLPTTVYDQIQQILSNTDDPDRIKKAQAQTNFSLTLLNPEKFGKVVESLEKQKLQPSVLKESIAKADKAVADAEKAQAEATNAPEKAKADAALATAQAQKAQVEAEFARAKTVLEVQQQAATLRKTNEDIIIAKENARIAALNAAIARETNVIKREELRQKIDDAKEKRDAADRDQKATVANQSADIDNFLNTATRVLQTPKDVIKSATGPVASRLPTLSGDVADFEALVEALGSQAFIAQIPKIKGTGSLSEKEGDKLQASLQTLSLKQSPERLEENVKEAVRLLTKVRENIAVKYGVQAPPLDVPARELSVSVGGTVYNFPTKAAADAFKNSDAYRRAAGTR
jgi:DNA-binding protein H-NS